MTAIINQNFRTICSRLFYDSFSDQTTNRYLFIGKSDPWADDTRPDTPIDSIMARKEAWNDMLAVKKITTDNISHVIPRFDWVTGTCYLPYDPDDADLFNHPTPQDIAAAQNGGWLPGSFYVMTDEYNVYICLDNANNSVSTVKPTDTSTATITYADGYKWKFMYHISNADTEKFVTNNWIPVKTLAFNDGSLQWAVQQAAVDGAIEAVRVITQGINYNNIHQGSVLSGTQNTITFANDGSVSDINGVYVGCTVFVVAGTGVGQSARILTYSGASKTATILCDQTGGNWSVIPANGDSYQIRPAIIFSGDGSSVAVAKATVINGNITNIDVTTPGAGFHFVQASIQGAGGSSASCKPIVAANGGLGKNPIDQLGASYIMISMELDYDEGNGAFPIDNDYRKIGVIADICNYGTSTLATSSTLTATPAVVLESITGTFSPDELVTGQTSGAEAIVIENIISGSGSRMKIHQNLNTGFSHFATSETIVGASSGATAIVSNLVNQGVAKYVGDVIYVEYRRPVTRSSEQKEAIRLIIEF